VQNTVYSPQVVYKFLTTFGWLTTEGKDKKYYQAQPKLQIKPG
jgi:hypothetical protein